jgi:hypothetical protein
VIIDTSAASLLRHGLSSQYRTVPYSTAQYFGKSLSAMRRILARQTFSAALKLPDWRSSLRLNASQRFYGDYPMSSDKPEDKMCDQLENLFGKPALLEGEDQERYLRLRAAVVGDLKPKSVFDWIDVHDQVNKLWEEQRYKHAAAALINGGLLKALQFYLNDLIRGLTLTDAEDLALNYFSTNAKEKKEVISLLAQHGITMAELQAKATQLEGAGLQMLDRMVSVRENGRRMLRKDAERRSLRPDQNNEG